MNKKLFWHFILCALCLSVTVSFGQNFSFTQFENEKDSVLRCEMGIESWNYYVKSDLDSLRIVGMKMINKDSTNLYGVGVRNLGSFEIRGNNINKGIELLLEAKEAFSRSGSLVLVSETENELGNAFFLLGNNREAANFYLASILHGSGSSDYTASYNGMLGFGKTICAIGDTTKGLLFVQKFLERSLKDEKYESAADGCGYLGMIAGNMGKVELMSAYFRRGDLYCEKSSSSAYAANAITNKAIDYFYHDKVDSSILLFQDALKIRKEVGATRPIVESLYNLSIFHIESENFEEAKKYAGEGESLSSERGIRSWQLDCLKLLMEIGMKTNDLSNIGSIKIDIERIEKELKEMSTLDNEIIDLAVQLTALHDPKENPKEYLWETISAILIVLCSGLLMYSYRFSST